MRVFSVILSLLILLFAIQPFVVAYDGGGADLIDEFEEIEFVETTPEEETQEEAQLDLQQVDHDLPVITDYPVIPDLQVSDAARESLRRIVAERDIVALVYLTSLYPVRASASESSDVIVSVRSGQQVSILDVEFDEFGNVWAYVSIHIVDVIYNGFVKRENLATADTRFLDWEVEYNVKKAEPAQIAPFAAIAPRNAAIAPSSAALPSDVAAFPPSYQAQLATLKAAFPNWTFVRHDTNICWNWMVAQQMVPGRALIHNSQPGFLWTGPAVEPGWHQATEVAVRHYMDPRNWLQTPHIFMFELLTFNPAAHTEPGVRAVLSDTFMRGNVGWFNFTAANPGGTPRIGANPNLTYSRAFYDAGRSLNVSPFFLAARVRQEQGVNGTSRLITGDWPAHPGFYNYFNIQAFGNTHDAIVNRGLNFARERGWNTRAASISGGASVTAASYIHNPLGRQNTIYLQKWNASAGQGNRIWHQYMTNIMAPRSESTTVFNSYNRNNLLNSPFVFSIPVYLNMPAAPSFLPTNSFDIALVPPAGFTNHQIFLDGIRYTAPLVNGQFVVNPGNASKRTATIYSYDANGIPNGTFNWRLAFVNGSYVTTPVPGLQNLLTYDGFSVRITGNSGIRFHSSIGVPTRNSLLSAGIDGFTLIEYGTLVMNNAHSANLPLIRGGQHTATGVSFGNGADVAFRVQNNQLMFTSVLINLPPEQYRTEFLFRSYAVLRRGGVDHVFYGPPVARSIYTVANQVLAAGQFPVGSHEYLFLRNIVS